MRWLFGSLLLANLVLFLWDSTQPTVYQGAPAPLPATVAGVAPLVLVGEQRALPTSPPAQLAEAATAAVPQSESQPFATEPEVPAKAPAPTEQPEPEPTPAPAPPAVSAPTPPPEPEPVVAPVIAAECTRFGPFSDEDRARAAARFLAGQNVYATLTTEGETRDARYIAYLPAADSRAAALERLRELKAKGIDSFIMGGAFNNAISLGVFSQQESALRLVTQMERRGYAVKIYSQERESAIHWLELGPRNTDRMSRELAATLTKRYPEARYEARSCP